MPWIALGWLTLYLQLVGFSDLAAAVLNALMALGCALGSYGGGLLGAAVPISTCRGCSTWGGGMWSRTGIGSLQCCRPCSVLGMDPVRCFGFQIGC